MAVKLLEEREREKEREKERERKREKERKKERKKERERERDRERSCNIRLYVTIMSRSSLRVNPHSIVYLNVKELLAKLSIRFRTKWLWVRTILLSLNENINSCPLTIESLHKSALR